VARLDCVVDILKQIRRQRRHCGGATVVKEKEKNIEEGDEEKLAPGRERRRHEKLLVVQV